MVLQRAFRSALAPLEELSSSSSSLLSDLARLSASAALIATGGCGPLSAPLPPPSPSSSSPPSPSPPPSPLHENSSGFSKTAAAPFHSAAVSSDSGGQGPVALHEADERHGVMSSTSDSSPPQVGQDMAEDSFDPLATRRVLFIFFQSRV